MRSEFPLKRQIRTSDCGPSCLYMILSFFGYNQSYDRILYEFDLSNGGASIKEIMIAGEKFGLKAKAVEISVDELIIYKPFPCIISWNTNHFIVIYEIVRTISFKGIFNHKNPTFQKRIKIADPATETKILSLQEFEKGFYYDNNGNREKGYAILFEVNKKVINTLNEKKQKSAEKNIIKFYRKALFHLILSLCLGSIISLIFPVITRLLFDEGIAFSDRKLIILLLLSQFFLVVGLAVNGVMRNWIIIHITSRISIKVISDYIKRILSQSYIFLENSLIGDLVQRFGDHTRINVFLGTTFINLVFSIFTFVLYSIFLGVYNIKIFIIFLLGSLLHIFFVLYFQRIRAKVDTERFIHSSNSLSVLYQIIAGAIDIKLCSGEKSKIGEWIITQTKLFKASLKGQTVNQSLIIGGSVISQSKDLFISIVAIFSVIKGDMTLGTFIAIQYIVGQLNGPILQFANQIKSIQDAKLSWNRLNEINQRGEIPKSKIPQESNFNNKYAFCLKNVSFFYSDSLESEILKNINLIIPLNKTTAIIGSSGSGKTTLFKLLLGMYAPTEGTIMFRGVNLRNIDCSKLYSKFGIVMQRGYIFNDSIAANINMNNSRYSNEDIVWACKVAGIHNYIIGLKDGYSTKLGPKNHNLSVGQQQRILLARALYEKPEYLFLDEATNSLDAETEANITRNINKYLIGKTRIIVTHNFSTIRNSDHIIVIKEGRIVEEGDHKSLIKSKEHYFQLIKDHIII